MTIIRTLNSAKGSSLKTEAAVLFRFLISGTINTFLGHGILFFCMLVLGTSPFLSNLIGYSVGLCASFALHRIYTFRSSGRALSEFLRFLPVFAICYAINLVALYLCINVFDINAVAAQLVAAAAYVGSSFLLNRVLVFRSLRPQAAPARAAVLSAEPPRSPT